MISDLEIKLDELGDFFKDMDKYLADMEKKLDRVISELFSGKSAK